MLPDRHRLRSSRDFHEVLRSGRRAASGTMVVHLLRAPGPATGAAVRVGLIVSRTVGDAVVRNRVKRRVRPLAGLVIPLLPPGSSLVVRANEPASRASSRALSADLDSCIRRLLGGTA